MLQATKKWLFQKISSVIMVPFMIWFLMNIVTIFNGSYDEAVNFVIESRRASISAVQRKLRIGYNRAARLIESMEAAGLVSDMSSNGSREVLVPKRN